MMLLMSLSQHVRFSGFKFPLDSKYGLGDDGTKW